MKKDYSTPDIPARYDADFLADVLAGLSSAPKTLPCRWLYDARGSELFEQITDLPEYYLTRTETAILSQARAALADRIGPNATLIEYGAGASVKTRLLLDALDAPHRYVPIDVSRDFLMETADGLRADYPGLEIVPIVANFLGPLDLADALERNGPNVGFFPGSTIGNLSDEQIHDFLSRAGQSLGRGSLFILGFDRVKPLERLLPAYDDAAGVTAAFNLNLLQRINRELDGTFDLDAFAHEARWNDEASRIEMHLVSNKTQTAQVAGRAFDFEKGESIHTENSRKFSLDHMEELCRAAGYALDTHFTDPEHLFSVTLLRQSG